MTEPNFHVGQTVVLVESRLGRGRRESEVTISRIGRKYAYIKRYGREVAFDLVTGHEKSASNYVDRIATPEMLAAEERRRSAEQRLATLGIQWRYYSDHRRYSTDALERVADILEGDIA